MARFRSGQAAAAGDSSTPVAWEKHVVRQEIVMCQTIICVEAIKLVEELFSRILQSTAITKKYEDVSSQLTSIMKEVAKELGHLVVENIWLTLPFGVFCYGLASLMSTLGDIMDYELHVVSDLVEAAKILVMDVINQGLDDLLDDCSRTEVCIDKVTLKYVNDMREASNYDNTVLQWAEFSMKRKDRNIFSHPWALLPQVEKRVLMRDLDNTLEDDFSLNFRAVGYIARLALITQDKEEGIRVSKQKESRKTKLVHLAKASRQVFEKERMEKQAQEVTEDNALEAGQFHHLIDD